MLVFGTLQCHSNLLMAGCGIVGVRARGGIEGFNG